MDYLTLTLQGDHYTQGRQHGRQVQSLRPQIAQAIADATQRAGGVRRDVRLAQIEQDGADARFERLVQETRDLLQEIDTPLLDMIRGQAEALEFAFDTLLHHALAIYLRDDLVIRKLQGVPTPPSDDPGDALRGGGELGGQGCTTWAACGSSTASGQPILVKNRDQTPEYIPTQIVARVAKVISEHLAG